jgi:hypothetical protein
MLWWIIIYVVLCPGSKVAQLMSDVKWSDGEVECEEGE